MFLSLLRGYSSRLLPGMGGRGDAGIFLSGTGFRGAAGLRELQQIPQQRLQVRECRRATVRATSASDVPCSSQRRPADELDQQRNVLRRRIRHILGARLHGACQRQVHPGRRHGGTRSGVYRLPGGDRHHAWLDVLGAHLLHDVTHPRFRQLSAWSF